MARILLVDDEDTVRGFLKRGLELDGHTVVTAIDGSDGLDRLSEAGGGFDLMLTDIRMPLMDGIALSLAAKRDYPELTIDPVSPGPVPRKFLPSDLDESGATPL